MSVYPSSIIVVEQALNRSCAWVDSDVVQTQIATHGSTAG